MTLVEHELKNAYIWEVWTPWSNTLLYLPLENNTDDKSWNNVSVSSAWISYWTAWNKNYAQRTGTASWTYITPSTSILSSIGTWDFTVSFFVYPVSPVSWQKAMIAWYRNQNDSSYPWIQILFTSDNKFFFQLNNSTQMTTSGTFSKNQWHYITITRRSNSVVCYVNWQQTNSAGTSINLGSATNWYILNRSNYTNQAWNETWARISEVIYEKAWWTQDYVVNYYNNIKANYWL